MWNKDREILRKNKPNFCENFFSLRYFNSAKVKLAVRLRVRSASVCFGFVLGSQFFSTALTIAHLYFFPTILTLIYSSICMFIPQFWLWYILECKVAFSYLPKTVYSIENMSEVEILSRFFFNMIAFAAESCASVHFFSTVVLNLEEFLPREELCHFKGGISNLQFGDN